MRGGSRGRSSRTSRGHVRVVTPAVYPKPRRLADPARLARTPAGRGGAEARDSLHHDMARARALRAFMATNDRRIDEPGSR